MTPGDPITQLVGPWTFVPMKLLTDAAKNPYAIAVYCVMASHARIGVGKLDTWPSRNRIAKLAKVSVRTADAALKWLVEQGYIAKETRTAKDGSPAPNIYTLQQLSCGNPPNDTGGVSQTVQEGVAGGAHEAEELEAEKDKGPLASSERIVELDDGGSEGPPDHKPKTVRGELLREGNALVLWWNEKCVKRAGRNPVADDSVASKVAAAKVWSALCQRPPTCAMSPGRWVCAWEFMEDIVIAIKKLPPEIESGFQFGMLFCGKKAESNLRKLLGGEYSAAPRQVSEVDRLKAHLAKKEVGNARTER